MGLSAAALASGRGQRLQACRSLGAPAGTCWLFFPPPLLPSRPSRPLWAGPSPWHARQRACFPQLRIPFPMSALPALACDPTHNNCTCCLSNMLESVEGSMGKEASGHPAPPPSVPHSAWTASLDISSRELHSSMPPPGSSPAWHPPKRCRQQRTGSGRRCNPVVQAQHRNAALPSAGTPAGCRRVPLAAAMPGHNCSLASADRAGKGRPLLQRRG
jgi:hypothetical protein